MKTKILNTIGILALAATFNTAAAQTSVPNTFSYQAVITAEDGSPVSNHDITVEVSIRQGNDCETNPSCPILWQELHAPKTNDFGSFSIEIGDDNAISTTGGSLSKYSDIDWLNTSSGNYYMQVRVDFGEASYLNGMTDLGTIKFSSVPYALAAKDADFAKAIKITNGKIANELKQLADVSISNPKPNQHLVYDGTAWKNTDPAETEGLKNISFSNLQTGDHLVYDATSGNWKNKAIPTPKLNDLDDVKIGTAINDNDLLVINTVNGQKVWVNKSLNIENLNNVSILANPTEGQVLTFSGSKWVAKTPAAGGDKVTKLAELTGDVELKNPDEGQILLYNKTTKKWENKMPGASDLWKTSGTNIYRNKSFANVGIGTDEPASLLHIKGGTESSPANTMLNGAGISMGSQETRITKNCKGVIAMGGALNSSDMALSFGTACIVGDGSFTGGTDPKNIIVMGKNSYSNGGNGIIIIGDDNRSSNWNCALFGQGLASYSDNQTICGQFNRLTDAAAFIVGNGNSKAEQSNAFVVYNDGTAILSGASLSSDSRLKTNVSSMSNALDNILKLRGVTFNWDKAVKINASDKTQYGFIAQEVETVFPDLVGTDSNGYKTVNYMGVIPVLTEAIKTQQDEIKELKSENEQLKSTLEQLLKRVEALEQNK